MEYQSYEEWRDETADSFNYLSDEEWGKKYGDTCTEASYYGWYMEDQVVCIDEKGYVFDKLAQRHYKEFCHGNSIKAHRWYHSVISRPEVKRISKEEYDNYGKTWRYAGLPGDRSDSEIVYLTTANK